MTDSILVSVAKDIADAIEAQRVGTTGFEIVDFEVSWGFDVRQTDLDIPEGPVIVRVVVPRVYDQVIMKTRVQLTFMKSKAQDGYLNKKYRTFQDKAEIYLEKVYPYHQMEIPLQ